VYVACIYNKPKLLKNLKENFTSIVGDSTRTFKTPSAPKTLIIRPKEGDPLNSPERQKTFRMGVGMLQYLVNHLRPDISNSVRELSKLQLELQRDTSRHFYAQSNTSWILRTFVCCCNQSSTKMVFIYKEFQTVNMLEILTHASVYMVTSCTFVVHQ
jgi:hypothetical protein